MKVYIEAASFYGNRSGVGRYGLCVSQELASLRPDDRLTFFSFLRPGRKLARDFDLSPNTRIAFIRWFPGRAFSLLMRKGISLPLELFGAWRADVVVFPNFVAWASLLHKKRIIVVHDIAFAYFPELIQSKNLAFLQKQLGKSLRRASKIVAVSASTKHDLVRTYHIPEEKVVIVHNAVDHAVFNPEAGQRAKQVREKLNLPARYLLFVGNIEPRKNLEGLLKAYGQSFATHKLPLVIVGGGKWSWNSEGIEQQFKSIAQLPIYRTGFIDDADMAALYASAVAFVYPSLYEGFGIPCLEAMASGCPVICSNTSSFPEIAGEAAIQVDPKDTDGLIYAINTLTGSQKMRQQLAQAGLEQSQKFTWETSAKQLSAVIDEVTGKQSEGL